MYIGIEWLQTVQKRPMTKKEMSGPTRALKEKTQRRDIVYARALSVVIKDFTDCDKCREGYFCFPSPCMSSYALSRTLTTLKVKTRSGKSTEWSVTQTTRELKNFNKYSRQFSLEQKRRDEE